MSQITFSVPGRGGGGMSVHSCCLQAPSSLPPPADAPAWPWEQQAAGSLAAAIPAHRGQTRLNRCCGFTDVLHPLETDAKVLGFFFCVPASTTLTIEKEGPLELFMRICVAALLRLPKMGAALTRRHTRQTHPDAPGFKTGNLKCSALESPGPPCLCCHQVAR